ncbi:MAG: class I SAM-dependent methyltransferase [Solirubrobacterales bacterium]
MSTLEGDSHVVPGLRWRTPRLLPWLSRMETPGRTRISRDLYYRSLARRVVQRRGTQARERSEDRRVLEQIIIPFILSRFEPRTVLDVGREAYEAFYNGFFIGQELWTIDRDPDHACFGSRNHVVGDVADLQDYFADQYFDFVLMNGVLGWGLNHRPAIEQAMAAIHTVLKPGGIFVLGWNNLPELTPVPLDQIRALREFRPCFLEPLNGASFLCSIYEHTFNIYTRR